MLNKFLKTATEEDKCGLYMLMHKDLQAFKEGARTKRKESDVVKKPDLAQPRKKIIYYKM